MKEIIKTTNNILPSTADIKKYAAYYLENKLNHLNPQQKKEFISMCAVHKLNPFKREIHASLYGNQLQIVVGYEVYLKRAAASGLLDGYTIDYDKSEPSNPIAIATVYRKGWSHPVVHKVAFQEYVQKTKEGKPNKFWAEKPQTMLEKVAISQAFRRAFPDIIDGLPYVKEETNELAEAPQSEDYACVNQQIIPEDKVIKNEETSKVTNTSLEDANELFA